MLLTVAIGADGAAFWNGQAVAPDQLEARLADAAKQEPQPELQLRADKNTRYEAVAQLMASAQSHGLSKLGFVTDPAKAAPKGER